MTEPVGATGRANEPLVVELARASASAGGKAAGLARLCAAGLPVPPGVALTGAAFGAVVGAAADATGAAPGEANLDELGRQLAAWAHAVEEHAIPPELESDVVARARALGGPLIVRSSMAIEDGALRAAPGVGLSIAGVAPDDVWSAIRAVWVASLTPMVAIYARGGPSDRVAATTGPAPREIAGPGVVVQREIAGERMTVYTRAPGRAAADEVWLVTHADATDDDAAARTTAQRTTARRSDARAEIVLAMAAERAIAAERGADVELVRDASGALFVVQARPLVHPPPRKPRVAPPPFVLAPLRASGRRWRRDITHNPDPMSTAQTELCELVERAAVAPFHLAVVAGFLYDAPRANTPGIDAPRADAPRSAEALEARFAAAATTVDRALAAETAAERGVAADLERALDGYLVAYRAIVELAPVIVAARAVLVDTLIAGGATRRDALARASELAPRRPSSLVAAVAAAARGELTREGLLALVGDMAPAWDVASPTFAETPALLDDAIARARARPAPPPEPDVPPALAAEVALARAAADIAERDDLLFARAQASVRRALLAVAARLGIPEADVFWLRFDELRGALAGDETAVASSRDDVRVRLAGRASAARAMASRAAQWEMPLVVAPDTAAVAVVGDAADGGAAREWRGDGLGGRAAGPAAAIEQLGDAARVPRGAVVVTRAVTPAMALLVEGAAAIVCEHGSLLDHGAAMARELGIPCVVGCAGITGTVLDGEWLEVDGDAGRVAQSSSSSSSSGSSATSSS